ncbi:hypothetical protein H0H92_012819 [Tricholoma furcatifolium]|nr:hypothetical protein H0H92_012819 [Tricholoma furcatifolium]
MSPSYQLPDLLSFCRSFELRTNPFCLPATLASESWLLSLKNGDSSDVLTGPERNSLNPSKYGLLAALCVPRCGHSQLLFFAKFLSIWCIADSRIKSAKSLPPSAWLSDVEEHEEGVEVLGKHELFKHFIPELQRLVAKSNPAWSTRFSRTVHSYHSAQREAVSSQMLHVIPDLQTYLSLRRNLSGISLLLDLIELTENLTLPPMDESTHKTFQKLKELAIDIIACSLDVVAFNFDQVQGNHNLITVLMIQERLSLQGAVNLAGSMIKTMFDTFAETERSLFKPSTSQQVNPPNLSVLSSSWSWLFSARVSPQSLVPKMEDGEDTSPLGDLSSYVHTLEDCIVGTINWAYETELYLGRKGEEIRTFGWVFLDPRPDRQANDSEQA